MTIFKIGVQIGGAVDGSFASSIRGSTTELNKLGSKLSEFKQQQKAIGKVELGEASLQKAREGYRAASQNVAHLRREMAKMGEPSKQLTQSFQKAKQRADRLSVAVEQQKAKLQRARQVLRQTGISTENLASENRRLGQSVETVTKQYQRMGKAVNARNALNAKRGELRGQLFDAVALGATVAAPVAVAVNFEQSVAQLGAITFDRDLSDEENKKNRSLLEEEARRLGKDTQFTASQTAEAMTFLGMAGFDTDQIKGSTEGVLNLAKAAGADLAETADISSNVLSGFGLDATQDMKRVGDVLASTFTSSNTTLVSLGETMKFVAPFARDAGSSIEEVAAMAGLLGDVGIQGSRAGTALRATFLRLSAPTGKAKEALESLGIEVSDIDGNLRPVPELLRDLSIATKNMGSVQRAGLLKQIFGEEPISGVSALLSQAGLTQLDAELEKVAKGGKGAAKIRETFAGLTEPFESASNKMQKLGITVFNANKKLRPVPDLIKSLSSATAGMKETQLDNFLKDIFNEDDVKIVKDLIKKSTTNLLDSEIQKNNGSDGINDRIAKQMSDTTLGSLQRLGAAMESIAISVGSVLLPSIASGAEFFAAIASGVSSFAETFPLLTQVVATATVGIIGLRIAVIASGFAWTFIQGAWLTFTSTLAIGVKVLTWATARLAGLNIISKATAINTKLLTIAQWAWNASLFAFRGAMLLGTTALTVMQAGMARLNILSAVTAVRMGIVTAAQWALNIAMTANPIGLIIVGIGALIGGAALLIKHWDKVKTFFSGFWAGIKEMTGSAVNWLLDAIGLLLTPFKMIAKVTNFVIGAVSDFFGADDEKEQTLSLQESKKKPSLKIGDSVNKVTASHNDISSISRAEAAVIHQSSNQSVAIDAPITIHAAPGADQVAIAQQVRQELDQRQAQADAVRRSNLFDGALI